MTRAELITALQVGGFAFLDVTAWGGYVDRAVSDAGNALRWPYRLRDDVATHQVPIVGLGEIPEGGVTGAGGVILRELSRSKMRERYGSDVTAGAPAYFERSGDDSLYLYPQGATVTVRHFSQRHWAAGGIAASGTTDTPLIPARYHDAIAYRARQFAYEDHDEDAGADRAEQRYLARIEEARIQRVGRQRHLVITGSLH